MHKKISLVLLCSITSVVAAANIELSVQELIAIDTHAKQWANTYIPQCSAQEMQLAANMLYLSYTGGLLDVRVRAQTDEMLTKLWQTRNDILAYQDTQQLLNQAKNELTLLQGITRMRYVIFKAWQACQSYIENQENNPAYSNILNALDELKEYGQEILQHYVHNDQVQRNQTIASAQQQFDATSTKLQLANRFYRGLARGDNIPDHIEPENIDIAIVDQTAIIAHKIEQSTWQAMQAAINVSGYQVTLEELSKLLYIAYYKALYAHMVDQDIGAKYVTFMFSPNGLIPDENRIKTLPNPEKLGYNIEINQDNVDTSEIAEKAN